MKSIILAVLLALPTISTANTLELEKCVLNFQIEVAQITEYEQFSNKLSDALADMDIDTIKKGAAVAAKNAGFALSLCEFIVE